MVECSTTPLREGRNLQLPAGLISYNSHVTSEDLWRDVGWHLRDVRERQGKKWLHVATEARTRFQGKLDPKTIQAIERGEPGQIDKLELLAQILGLSIVDVLSSVLKDAEQRPTPEAAALLRCFEHLGVVDRRLLLESAQRLLEQHEARTRLELQVAAAAANPAPAPGRRPTPPRTR
jgi:transcriptional regulator with XRE-family HTH domain